MSLNQYAREITKTGFELEFRVSEVFRQLGWTVIANKYYVDDQQGTVREIDLVAYRVTRLSDFRVSTIAVVSCKKNERDAWVLLAKDLDPRDPNMDWRPMHTWANQRVLKHMLGRVDWRADYAAFVAQQPCGDLQQIPRRHVFAFQEMSKATGKPNNDRKIFESITSLMKAQAYELTALPQRSRWASVYQFNLLSVADTDLVRLDFRSTGEIEESLIAEETYVARYIIAKQQTFARIHFVQFAALSNVLARYNALHEANVAFFDGLNSRYYQNDIRFGDGTQIFWDLFIKHLSVAIRWHFHFGEEMSNLVTKGWLSWSTVSDEVHIHIIASEGQVDLLNSHGELRRKLADLLKHHYRYEGGSRFVVGEEIPF